MLQDISGRAKLVRWAALIVLSTVIVVVLELAHLPAALLLGPMLAGILFAALKKTVQVSNRLTSVATLARVVVKWSGLNDDPRERDTLSDPKSVDAK